MKVSGSCYILLAYDIGLQIDIDACAQLLTVTTERLSILPRHKAPKHFEYRSRPLRLTQRADPLPVGGFNTLAAVDLVLYEFGSVSLAYRIPFECQLEELVTLSEELYDNATFQKDALRRVEELLSSIRSTINKPQVTAFSEDYLIFEVNKAVPGSFPHDFLAGHAQEISQILASDRTPLAEQEVKETLADSISYTPHDAVVITWNAAFIYGQDAEDLRAVLEFANLQLLEMRYVDNQLDQALEQSYDILNRRRKGSFPLFYGYDDDMRRVAELQVDAALLFEGVSNALKLLGDQYLARVYRMAERRFSLSDWDRGITRKLAALESIYQKLADRADSMRMETLEIIIILLILVSIALPFVIGH